MLSPSDPTALEAVERAVERIVVDTLGIEAIDRDTSFFDRGGASLAAVQITLQVAEQFDVDLSLIVVCDYPTVREIAREVRLLQGSPSAL